MIEIFKSNLFLFISLVALLLLGLYREWEENRLFKELGRIFCERKLDNEKTFSIRQLDIFLYHTIQRLFNYIFRGFFTRQILNQYIIFPLAIVISLYLISKGFINSNYDIQNLVLFITFIAILWYSKETFALREEQKKANEILIGRPLVVVIKEPNGEFISIKNLGNNIARDVIANFRFFDYTKRKISIPIIIHQKDGIVYEISKELTDLIDSCDKDLKVIINYRDFHERNKYETELSLDADIIVEPNGRKGRFKIISDKNL